MKRSNAPLILVRISNLDTAFPKQAVTHSVAVEIAATSHSLAKRVSLHLFAARSVDAHLC